MTTGEIITLTSIISALLSAILVTILNYFLGLRLKKADFLIVNRTIGFKEVSKTLIAFKNFCSGKIAFEQGNEYSPFYEEGFGALHHRTEISLAMESNSIFFSVYSRKVVTDLLNEMSGLCNGEASLAAEASDLSLQSEYERMESMAEKAITVLYDELGIPKI